MLQGVMIRGEASRGEVIAASGLKERTGRYFRACIRFTFVF